MKFVNWNDFVEIKEEVVFSYFYGEPSGLFIKEESLSDSDGEITDYIEQELICPICCSSSEYFDLIEESRKDGKSVSLDFSYSGRDGMFDEERSYLVWSKNDVQNLIKRLKKVYNSGMV